MIDLHLLRKNPDLFRDGVRKKQASVDINGILDLDGDCRKFQKTLEEKQQELNKRSKEVAMRKKPQIIDESLQSKAAGKVSFDEQGERERLRILSDEIQNLKSEIQNIKSRRDEMLLQIPNLPHESVPEGENESRNQVLRTWGEPREFFFKPKDHLEIGEKLNLIDAGRAAKVSGSRFYYLKNDAVLLEFALIQWVMALLVKEGFSPMIPPVLAREEIFYSMGYLPHADTEMYKTTLDELRLAATSEQTIGPLFMDEILKEDELPQKFAGFSSCFRREAGSYGKDVRGIFRAHQFDKVEMFVFCRPEEACDYLEQILSLEEKIMQELQIPYRVVIMCAGDLGFPVAKKYDVEAWLPSQEKYRETHSCSNCTDFQARRLNIRFRRKDKSVDFVHTLNGTACAIGRTLIAILENYQQEDGTVVIPSCLRPYIGKEKIEAGE